MAQSQYMITEPTESLRVWGSGAYRITHYDGSFSGQDLGTSFPVLTGDGSDYGAEAYRRMKPTKPTFPGLNAIYELREVPEMLRQRFLESGLYAIPNYWLALKFGWEPLLNDIRNCIRFQQAAQKKLAWLLRHNGKPVRTRVDLADSEVESAVTRYDWRTPSPGFVTQYYSGVPYSLEKTVTKNKIWAAARFRYWLPPGPRDINWTRAMNARLFGLMPSPVIIWNMLPWTWLSDWFFDTGNILSNMDAGVAERCAADWFYVMREQTQEYRAEYHATMYLNPSNALHPITTSSVRGTTLKTRVVGDPFGFGTKDIDLSAMQLSILGALGLSRVRGVG